MAISVNREGNLDGSIDLTINISTTQFFNEYWEKAIKKGNIPKGLRFIGTPPWTMGNLY